MTKARDLSQTPNASLGFKNRIINGDMRIDQRNAGASVTPTNTVSATYSVDRWATYGSAASKFSIQQNAGSVTPPNGFTNYLGITSLASTTAGAGDLYYLYQPIEGFNFSDFGFGSVNASVISLSFWVRSSLTGTFSGAITNGAYNRAYPFTYTISAANTWEYKTVTIAGDTTGTWATNNSTGANLFFNLGTGSTNLGTANSWTGSGKIGVTGSVNVLGTNGATFYITGVQLEKGSTATSFDCRPYGTELALCQRYYSSLKFDGSLDFWLTGYLLTAEYLQQHLTLPVPMRATPTITTSGSFVNLNTGGLSFVAASPQTVWARLRATGTGTTYSYNSTALSVIASSEL